jgi:sugar transferase (PEP-CTERM/EpsH1 system associated)
MKILILDEEFPFPLNTGKRIRTFNLVARLAKKHQVYYLAYGIKGSVGIKALTQAGITPLAVERQIPPKSGVLFYFRLLLNLFSRYPYIVSSHYSSLFADKLSDCLKQIRFDIVIAEWTPYAVYLNEVKEARKVIVAHNLEHRIWERYFRNESNLLKKWYIGKQLKKVRRFEIESFASVDAVTAVSPIEAEEIVRYGKDLTVEVIPNGVDLDYFSSEDEETASSSMIFVGSMNWRPNQDAIQYFVREIFPLIKKDIKDAQATFVGQDPPPAILKLGDIAGIEIVGRVDDVRPFVRKAAVYIVPLRIGGGTRLKILEAMAMKKAIVSTSVGAEGIAVAPDVNILIGDNPETFAAQVKKLITNRNLGQKLGNAGRELVERGYGWDRIAAALDNFLSRLAGKS